MENTKNKIGIIGGGLSGLSAAVYLLKNHPDQFEISVFEAAPHLGGQAASWTDSDGDPVETGIHLDFPWYQNKPRLYEDIGRPLKLRETDGNYYICDGRKGYVETLYAGVSVWKTFYGLATFPGLKIRERWKMAKLIWRFIKMSDLEIESRDRQSVTDFLQELGCSDGLIRQLALETVTIQGLRADRASAASFVKFLKAMYGCEANFNQTFFAAPIGDTLIAPLERFIKENSGLIHCGRKIDSVGVDVAENRAFVLYMNGEPYVCDYVIVAIPGYLVPKILPNFYVDAEPFARLNKLESAKVITLQLWYDARVFPDGNVFISNREGVIFDVVADKAWHWQWPRDRGSLIQVLIDAADDVAKISDEEIYGNVLLDLQRFFPKCGPFVPRKWNILRHQNIYSETKPGYWSLVPRRHETPIQNLFLAGDYTDGPYHYGMESAVISGKACANLILDRHHLPTHPILPVKWLPFVNV